MVLILSLSLQWLHFWGEGIRNNGELSCFVWSIWGFRKPKHLNSALKRLQFLPSVVVFKRRPLFKETAARMCPLTPGGLQMRHFAATIMLHLWEQSWIGGKTDHIFKLALLLMTLTICIFISQQFRFSFHLQYYTRGRLVILSFISLAPGMPVDLPKTYFWSIHRSLCSFF